MSSPKSLASPSRLIPPPVYNAATNVNDVSKSTVRLKAAHHKPETIVVLHRQERQVHDQIQELLNAQVAALDAAVSGESQRDVDMSGSLTPTVQSLRSGQPAQSQPARRRKIGIRAARKGIRDGMRQMAAIKERESHLLDTDHTENHAVLEQIEQWDNKRQGLQKQITEIESDGEGSRIDGLRRQAQSLESEIHELEMQLAGKKSQHSHLLAEISQIDNSVQAKLSSYKSSMSLLESDIKVFLRTAPEQKSARISPKSDALSQFLNTPAKRRSLWMAKEHWKEKLKALENEQKYVDREKDALEEGAVVWESVVDRIVHYEEQISNALQRDNVPETDVVAQTRELLAQLEDTIQFIENKHELAEERQWNLLVCCIAAELNALMQGRKILESMLNAAQGIEPKTEREQADVDVAFKPSFRNGSSSDEAPSEASYEAFLRSTPTPSPEMKKTASRPSEQEHEHEHDDEPDPELLISHQDTDDE